MRIRNKKGFTLIEIGIVLMVIGIIIGAIMKGKDIIKSAQTKDFTQTFLNRWVMVVDNYYDRIGQNLSDGVANGSEVANSVPDGYMDGTALYTAANQEKIADALSNAGINVVALVKSNLNTATANIFANNYNPFETSVAGEFTDQVNVGVALTNLLIAAEKTGAANIRRNFVIFKNVPGDIAVAFDKLIDGVANGESGRVLAFSSAVSTTGSTVPAVATAASAVTAPKPYVDIETGLVFTIGVMLEH